MAKNSGGNSYLTRRAAKKAVNELLKKLDVGSNGPAYASGSAQQKAQRKAQRRDPPREAQYTHYGT